MNGLTNAERVAGILRESAPEADELAVRRMELAIFEELDAHPTTPEQADELSLVATGETRSELVNTADEDGRESQIRLRAFRRRRGAVIATVMVLAAATFFAIGVSRSREKKFFGAPARHANVSPESMLRSGMVLQPQHVASTRHAFDTRIVVHPRTQVRAEKITESVTNLQLSNGSIDVAFHPQRRGAQHCEINTPLARVIVVGTEFRVTQRAGFTHVRVEEGAVRVISTADGRIQTVRAGESMTVHTTWAGGAAASSSDSAETDAALSSDVDQDSDTVPNPVSQRARAHRRSGKAPESVQQASDDAVTADNDKEAHLVAQTNSTEKETAVDAAEKTLPAAKTKSHRDARRTVRAWRPTTAGIAQRREQVSVCLAASDPECARHHLYAVLRLSESARERAFVWQSIAETFEAGSKRASEALRRSSGQQRLAQHDMAGRLRHAASLPTEDAKAAYRSVLRSARTGTHAVQAAAALCRLGESEHCQQRGVASKLGSPRAE